MLWVCSSSPLSGNSFGQLLRGRKGDGDYHISWLVDRPRNDHAGNSYIRPLARQSSAWIWQPWRRLGGIRSVYNGYHCFPVRVAYLEPAVMTNQPPAPADLNDPDHKCGCEARLLNSRKGRKQPKT